MLDAVHHYGMALQLGQKHVYQALPRLLAMWLEFTSLDVVNCDDKKSMGRDAHNGKSTSSVIFFTFCASLTIASCGDNT